MLEILLIVAAVIVAAVAVILGLALMRPRTFRVERSATMRAAPDKVFALINDLHAFNSWNPFLKMDPASKLAYCGPATGRGAAYTWESRKIGAGRMEIVDAAAPSKVTMKLDFYKPFPGSNVAEFSVDGGGQGTSVTWSLAGPVAFVPRIMGLFFSMDAMMGQAFEAGLADLKAKAEA